VSVTQEAGQRGGEAVKHRWHGNLTGIATINAIAGAIAAAVERQGVATMEIAHNVAETASAANAMNSRDVTRREHDRFRLTRDLPPMSL
jgi:hypothetical protein